MRSLQRMLCDEPVVIPADLLVPDDLCYEYTCRGRRPLSARTCSSSRSTCRPPSPAASAAARPSTRGIRAGSQLASAPLGDARPNEHRDQIRGQRLVRREADRSLAQAVFGQLLAVRLDGVGASVEGAVLRRRPEREEEPSALAVGWHAIADALFGVRRGGADVATELLQRGALISGERREILINRAILRSHLLPLTHALTVPTALTLHLATHAIRTGNAGVPQSGAPPEFSARREASSPGAPYEALRKAPARPSPPDPRRAMPLPMRAAVPAGGAALLRAGPRRPGCGWTSRTRRTHKDGERSGTMRAATAGVRAARRRRGSTDRPCSRRNPDCRKPSDTPRNCCRREAAGIPMDNFRPHQARGRRRTCRPPEVAGACTSYVTCTGARRRRGAAGESAAGGCGLRIRYNRSLPVPARRAVTRLPAAFGRSSSLNPLPPVGHQPPHALDVRLARSVAARRTAGLCGSLSRVQIMNGIIPIRPRLRWGQSTREMAYFATELPLRGCRH